MLKTFRKSLGIAALSAAMIMGASAPANAADDTITIGWTAWADAEFITKLSREVIENNWDYDVKLTLSAIALQFQAVAGGDIDGMLMAWLPDTHAAYWKRYKDQVVDLGSLYEGAKLGWVVPAYVPKDKLNSIKDLHKDAVRQKLGGIITGIDPGAGIMQLSEDTLKAYDLGDYTLRSSSAAAMTAALGKAISNHKWIVVTGWTPHWMFGRFNLRFLQDPKGTMGGPQHIDAVVREGFKQDYPAVAQFLANIHVPLDVLQHYMYIAQKSGYDTAINQFIDEQQELLDTWLPESK